MIHETVTLSGHIIDSLTLPKVLDQILSLGGTFSIIDIEIGKTRLDSSKAVVRIEANSDKDLSNILSHLQYQGVTFLESSDVRLEKAPKDGVFPDGFYSTSNLETYVRYNANWVLVEGQEMDVGVRFEKSEQKFISTPMNDVKEGDLFVVSHNGVRTASVAATPGSHGFRFMSSSVSTEKPTGRLVSEVAKQLSAVKEKGLKILFVLGPAVVHGGATNNVERLINDGWLDILFAGNALATHDIESSFFGTSLGVSLSGGNYAEHGNEHHLRAINCIRKCGSIKEAVENGVLKSGIMYSCVKKEIPFVLAGSIRDDGPLPEVIIDVIKAQNIMRQHLADVGIVIVVGTVLHGIAVGNLLPGAVPMVCVDTNPASVTKFSDRGSTQCMGIVMNGASFFQDLVGFLR